MCYADGLIGTIRRGGGGVSNSKQGGKNSNEGCLYFAKATNQILELAIFLLINQDLNLISSLIYSLGQ